MHMVVLFQRLRKTFGTYGGVVLRLRKTFGAYGVVVLEINKDIWCI